MRPSRLVGLLLIANAGAFACGSSEDEHPPMMGDCATCTTQAPSGGGVSSGDGGTPATGNLDAQTSAPDGLDIVDVGVLAPEAGSDATDMLPDALDFAH